MPAKYLGVLAEDRRSDIHRQVGCVTGILQAFDRRHPLASSHKRLLPPTGSLPCSAFSSLAGFSFCKGSNLASVFFKTSTRDLCLGCRLFQCVFALWSLLGMWPQRTPVFFLFFFLKLRSGHVCNFNMDKTYGTK